MRVKKNTYKDGWTYIAVLFLDAQFPLEECWETRKKLKKKTDDETTLYGLYNYDYRPSNLEEKSRKEDLPNDLNLTIIYNKPMGTLQFMSEGHFHYTRKV